MTNYQLAFDNAFIALADPTRRSVVERLALGPRSVSELARNFQLALPTFLAHLRILERAGLVRTAKAGRVRTCTLDPAVLAAAETWMGEQRRIWAARLDQMDTYVKQLQEEEENARRETP